MKVTKKVIKNLVVNAIIMTLGGCASIDSISKNQLKTQSQMSADGTQIIYGQMGAATKSQKIEICNAIKNIDPKCLNDKYEPVWLMVGFGFSDAAFGAFTWVPNDLEYYKCSRFGNNSCTFAKAKLVDGRYADFIEIASENRDGKCKWNGLPRAGGVVCSAYQWDYRQNLNDWSTTSGITTIKKR